MNSIGYFQTGSAGFKAVHISAAGHTPASAGIFSLPASCFPRSSTKREAWAWPRAVPRRIGLLSARSTNIFLAICGRYTWCIRCRSVPAIRWPDAPHVCIPGRWRCPSTEPSCLQPDSPLTPLRLPFRSVSLSLPDTPAPSDRRSARFYFSAVAEPVRLALSWRIVFVFLCRIKSVSCILLSKKYYFEGFIY